MLKEIHAVQQVPGESRRRWFTSLEMDLVVWMDGEGRPNGFQLCYDRSAEEHALTWTAAEGFSHMAVDDGEGREFRHKASPILVPGGPFDAARIAGEFARAGEQLPADISRLVAERIAEFGRRG